MSISGIGAYGYPAGGFGITKRGAKKADRANTTGQIDETLQRSEMSGGAFELHISNDEDRGDREAFHSRQDTSGP